MGLAFAGLVLPVVLLLVAVPCRGQAAKAPSTTGANPLQQHYDAAQAAQAAGDLPKAALEYRLFLGEALHRVANARASVNDFAQALPAFDEALSLVPSDVDLRVDYADACRQSGDAAQAKELAQAAIDAEPRNPRAHLVLARTLSDTNERQAAAEQFEVIVAIQPNFENGYALAVAYLRAKDETNAARVFAEMLKGFGDSPELHMKFGSAYGAAGYPNQAIAEFKKVIAKNPSYPGAHYSLGAAYLVGLSDAVYPEAAAEFRKELVLNPNDYNSRFQLGYIELNQHKLQEAEVDLKRATELDGTNPDAFLSLGQLYVDSNRADEAEAALRKAIALTTDVSRNHYQVQRAHYLLARLLVQSGKEEEAKAEMQISQSLMDKSVLQNQGKDTHAAGNDTAVAGTSKPGTDLPVPPPGAVEQVQAFEKQVGPAIADAYNNLGAIAAGDRNFPLALNYFQQAFVWNPSLAGLDYNWSRAAISAGSFEQAIPPLDRYLKTRPDDLWARSALGTSFFMLKKYDDALKTLQPMRAQIDGNSELASVYATCLIKTGDYKGGIDMLQAMEKKNPGVASTHETLGEAFARQRDFKDAAEELRAAAALAPENLATRYNLASALIELHEDDEARGLLMSLVQAGWQDPHVYFSLGKLELARGDLRSAITNLETAARMSPNSGPIHHELAQAYLRDSRKEDADREMKLYESLKNDLSKPGGAAKPE
ncbi:MAG TPA: tetratricopeptide repeat protein [Candidatus Limnocylindrales bacterium]|nr:tetratricopeptide repeat protein [Candidatus Limnocylindrales bacterium]